MDNTNTILVTGGAGFLGSHVVSRLHECGYDDILVPRSADYDLRKSKHVNDLFQLPIDIVIHLAAQVGGIGANLVNPGSFFYDNAIMGIQLMDKARERSVKKFITAGTICSYPKHTDVPFNENDIWLGYPEETNAPYGLAKKMLMVQGQAYRQEYDFNSIHLLIVNLYGPGDNFAVDSSHVVPALIRKCIEAKASNATKIVCWGDGSQTREFLYAPDAAEAIVLAMEKYDDDQPINIGTGHEITIYDLVHLIAKITGFTGAIEWDTSKPNGQPRRCLDTNRAKTLLDFEAKTELEEGLTKTIEYAYDELFSIFKSENKRGHT